jgi:hypothetical protein
MRSKADADTTFAALFFLFLKKAGAETPFIKGHMWEKARTGLPDERDPFPG